MNLAIGSLICFIVVAIMAVVGLILLWWNPNKKNQKNKDKK